MTTLLKPEFPHLGWSDVHQVPADMVGATILFVGSFPNKAELVIDFQTAKGERKRITLGFTGRGMWPKNE